MRGAINAALANRQILTQLTRNIFNDFFPKKPLGVLYDVSHNTCKEETHIVNDVKKKLYVHRKGATRAFGPGHPDLPETIRHIGQPVLVGGSMGTASFVLVGTASASALAFSSACHGAGRAMSRTEAKKIWQGKTLIEELAEKGIIVRAPSLQGIAEEAPGAYKDVVCVVEAT